MGNTSASQGKVVVAAETKKKLPELPRRVKSVYHETKPPQRKRGSKRLAAIGDVSTTHYDLVQTKFLRRTQQQHNKNGVSSSNIDKKQWQVCTLRIQCPYEGCVVQAYGTSTYGPRTQAMEIATLAADGVVNMDVHLSKRIPNGLRITVVVSEIRVDAKGTHGLHNPISKSVFDLDVLMTGSPYMVGEITATLLNPGQLRVEAGMRIVRPDVEGPSRAYLEEYYSKTFGKFVNGARFSDGASYPYEPRNDWVPFNGQRVPLLVYLYGATRMHAEDGDEFAEAQVRMGCLLCGIHPSKLGGASDAVKLLVLCFAARAASETISVLKPGGGHESAYNLPLSSDAIDHFSGQCVEHCTLVAVVLMHIRDSKTALCKHLQPLLKTYRIGQLLIMQSRTGGGVPRHMTTALVPKACLQEGSVPLAGVCVLDTVCNMPIHKNVTHPGDVPGKLCGIFPYMCDEKTLGTQAGTCVEIFFVDRDDDIRQTVCIHEDGKTIGVAVVDLYADRGKPTLYAPVCQSAVPISACQPLIDETRQLTNLVSHRQSYFTDKDPIWKVAIPNKGWKIALFDYVPEETPQKLPVLIERSVAQTRQYHPTANAREIGRVVFFANVVTIVYLISY